MFVIKERLYAHPVYWNILTMHGPINVKSIILSNLVTSQKTVSSLVLGYMWTDRRGLHVRRSLFMSHSALKTVRAVVCLVSVGHVP